MDILRAIVAEPDKLAIVCLFAIPAIGLTCFQSLKLYLRHRERIELIQQGIHPDFLDEEVEEIAAAKTAARKKKNATSS